MPDGWICYSSLRSVSGRVASPLEIGVTVKISQSQFGKNGRNFIAALEIHVGSMNTVYITDGVLE